MLRIIAISLALLLSTAAQAQEYVPGEVIVKLKSAKKSGVSQSQFMGKIQGKYSLKSSFNRLNMHRFKLADSKMSVQQAVEELRKDPEVEYAEPNYILKKIQDDEAVNSQSYSAQELQAMGFTSNGYSQSYADVNVDEAWARASSLSQNPQKIVVAVIDTGVDYTHSIFTRASAIWTNSGEIPGNGIDDDRNGYIDDVRGWNFYADTSNPMDDDEHGTHVAGIILGATQNIFSSSAEESKVLIMPLKFLGANGSGSTSDAVAAIYYAVNMGAQVINNSWGGGSYSQALHDALSYAYNHRLTVVSAAGNYSSNNDSVNIYPANYPVPSQISVAATSDWDNIASFSNYGLRSVHVGSPGVAILSAIPGQSYRYMSGTSMAAPFVAGLAALALREAPDLTGYQVKNLIMNSTRSVNSLSTKVYTGGRVDAELIVSHAQSEMGTEGFLPSYKAAQRDVASEAPAGCGLVSSGFMRGTGGQGPFDNPSGISMILALTLLPVVVWQVMRTRAGKNRRKYDRFVMNSDIRVQVGDRELVGHMKTISLGGLSFNADAMLEKGGVVTMQIASPDGSEKIEVQGHIVWSEANKAYGVQFDAAKKSVLEAINAWTGSLAKSST